MRPLKRLRRWKYLLKRAIARYGPHPYTAIYCEALRRRYVRLGRWLARRYEPKPAILAKSMAQQYMEAYPTWQPEPEPPIVPPAPPVLGIRQRAQLRQASGELFTAPIRRIELLPDDSWLNSTPHTGPIAPIECNTEPTVKVPAVQMQAIHKQKEQA